MHIFILLALYDACGFCLLHSLSFLAGAIGCVFLVSAWIGMFVSLTHVIILMLERVVGRARAID